MLLFPFRSKSSHNDHPPLKFCPGEALNAWTDVVSFLYVPIRTAFLPEGPDMRDSLLERIIDKGLRMMMLSEQNQCPIAFLIGSRRRKVKKLWILLCWRCILFVFSSTESGGEEFLDRLFVQRAVYNWTKLPQEVALEVDSQIIVLIGTPDFHSSPMKMLIDPWKVLFCHVKNGSFWRSYTGVSAPNAMLIAYQYWL